MPREFSRKVRVTNAIKKTIAPLIDAITRDHQLGMISVTEVDVSSDYQQSTIYVSVFGSTEQHKLALNVLQERAKKLRHELSQLLPMKSTPALHFRLDPSLEQGDKINRLIRSVNEPPRDD